MGELSCRPDARDKRTPFLGQGPEVAFHLQSMPEALGLAKESAETDRHGRRDGPPTEDDLVDGSRGDSDRARHGVLGNSQRLQILLQENLPGGDDWTHGYNV